MVPVFLYICLLKDGLQIPTIMGPINKGPFLSETMCEDDMGALTLTGWINPVSKNSFHCFPKGFVSVL